MRTGPVPRSVRVGRPGAGAGKVSGGAWGGIFGSVWETCIRSHRCLDSSQSLGRDECTRDSGRGGRGRVAAARGGGAAAGGTVDGGSCRAVSWELLVERRRLVRQQRGRSATCSDGGGGGSRLAIREGSARCRTRVGTCECHRVDLGPGRVTGGREGNWTGPGEGQVSAREQVETVEASGGRPHRAAGAEGGESIPCPTHRCPGLSLRMHGGGPSVPV